MTRVAVIGGGWAGAAAALTLARAGVRVTLFEATSAAGGRARGIEKDGRCFDNGQHLLLGAYERTLAMIASVHTAPEEVVLRSPLRLNSAPGLTKPLRLRAPRIVAPLHLLVAILGASGLSFTDKISTLLWAARNLRTGGSLWSDEATVAELISRQPEAARRLLWEPLCVAALNTPAASASARVFLHVLQQAFNNGSRASDLIIPRVDLSQLLPVPALIEVARLGGKVKMATVVMSIRQSENEVVVSSRDDQLGFAAVVIATGPQHVARLLGDDPAERALAATLKTLQYEPISTLYFEFATSTPTESTDMLMLDGDPGQWLFWQRQANGQWRASIVISAHHRQRDDGTLAASALAQLRRSYALSEPSWQLVITEKRATYACTPNQRRRLAALPKRIGKVFFAGDWCFPELPATLEAAVISGENAAHAILTDSAEG